MKYKVGDRWIWKEDVPYKQELIGYISEIKPGGTIVIKWENGYHTQYTEHLIDCYMTKLKFDKEWYRNQKLNELGI